MKFVEYFLTEISLHHRRMKIIRVFPRKTSCIQMILLNPQRNVSEKYGSMKQCRKFKRLFARPAIARSILNGKTQIKNS